MLSQATFVLLIFFNDDGVDKAWSFPANDRQSCQISAPARQQALLDAHPGASNVRLFCGPGPDHQQDNLQAYKHRVKGLRI